MQQVGTQVQSVGTQGFYPKLIALSIYCVYHWFTHLTPCFLSQLYINNVL